MCDNMGLTCACRADRMLLSALWAKTTAPGILPPACRPPVQLSTQQTILRTLEGLIKSICLSFSVWVLQYHWSKFYIHQIHAFLPKVEKAQGGGQNASRWHIWKPGFLFSFFFSFDLEICEEKFVEFRATVQCPTLMNSQVSEAVILKMRFLFNSISDIATMTVGTKYWDVKWKP